MYLNGFDCMQSEAYADDDAAAASVVFTIETRKKNNSTRGKIGRFVVVLTLQY